MSAVPKKYRLEVTAGRDGGGRGGRGGFTDIIVARRDAYPGDPDGYEAVVRIEGGTVTCNACPEDPELAQAVQAALDFAETINHD